MALLRKSCHALADVQLESERATTSLPNISPKNGVWFVLMVELADSLCERCGGRSWRRERSPDASEISQKKAKLEDRLLVLH